MSDIAYATPTKKHRTKKKPEMSEMDDLDSWLSRSLLGEQDFSGLDPETAAIYKALLGADMQNWV